ARSVAARRTVEPGRPGRRQRKERRRLDEGAVVRRDVVGLLGDRRPVRRAVDLFQRFNRGDEVIVAVDGIHSSISGYAPGMSAQPSIILNPAACWLPL